jgi:hypothetical protein
MKYEHALGSETPETVAESGIKSRLLGESEMLSRLRKAGDIHELETRDAGEPTMELRFGDEIYWCSWIPGDDLSDCIRRIRGKECCAEMDEYEWQRCRRRQRLIHFLYVDSSLLLIYTHLVLLHA